MGVLAWVFGKKRPALAEGIDDLLRARLRELLDKDPEFRSILRHAVREHLELLRDDLVSLSKAYQELGDALINSFETTQGSVPNFHRSHVIVDLAIELA